MAAREVLGQPPCQMSVSLAESWGTTRTEEAIQMPATVEPAVHSGSDAVSVKKRVRNESDNESSIRSIASSSNEGGLLAMPLSPVSNRWCRNLRNLQDDGGPS